MSTPIPQAVENYLQIVEQGEYLCCKEQIALAAYVRRIFETEELHVDEKQLEKYLSLAKYFPFQKLMPWEEFLIALWDCTYRADGRPRWRTVFCMVGRGAGKDGFIAFDSFCSVSPYNLVKYYDVDICANNEDQAMRPVGDICEVLDSPDDPKLREKLDKHYYHTKELVQGVKNRGTVRGRTGAAKGKDGLRSGKIFLNEVHEYQNYDKIKVLTSGLGKKATPKRGIFTSNGEVSDGPLDDYLARAQRILFEGEIDRGFLPFVCRLDSADEVHEEQNWYKANPSLAYFPHLLDEIRDEYAEWLEHPEENGDFLTKRMGLRAGFKEISVTDYDKVLVTKQDLPELSGWSCIAGIDYAELSDWASVCLHFKRGYERFDLSHSWLCLKSKTLSRVQAPWQDWAERGLVTPVDDMSIAPEIITSYIQDAARKFNIRMLAMDGYRWALMAEALRAAGWDAADKTRVKLVRPSDIMQVEPVIQECFDRGYFHWGDTPPLRWAVNNTKRVRSAKKWGVETGNFIYAKIEPKSRKTDPFMALVAAMTCEETLGTGAPVRAPMAAIAI